MEVEEEEEEGERQPGFPEKERNEFKTVLSNNGRFQFVGGIFESR